MAKKKKAAKASKRKKPAPKSKASAKPPSDPNQFAKSLVDRTTSEDH